ncbi:DUF397 domain-containing protein [Actinomadura kijaniata]|uniref:DUF397 domain-containing protein n=1 Tax=Actinomadura kijaniata TaxID=46161 RepID=UPI000830525D|nr:DUF397 domain-containing protein [Actinomadura kijaniata]
MELRAVGWRKARRSSEEGDQCIELAGFIEVVALRDSKDPEGPKLLIGRAEARGLAERIKELGAG